MSLDRVQKIKKINSTKKWQHQYYPRPVRKLLVCCIVWVKSPPKYPRPQTNKDYFFNPSLNPIGLKIMRAKTMPKIKRKWQGVSHWHSLKANRVN